MKRLWSQWQKLDARAKAPYETRAAQDIERYRREVMYYDWYYNTSNDMSVRECS